LSIGRIVVDDTCVPSAVTGKELASNVEVRQIAAVARSMPP
jgi:hypothetical protein